MLRLRPAGEPPSPRAAHAAAAVGTMVVFQVIRNREYTLNWIINSYFVFFLILDINLMVGFFRVE